MPADDSLREPPDDLEGPMDDDAWLAMEDAEEGGGATDHLASRFGYGDDDA